MRPIWSVIADGADISDRLGRALLGLTITDQAGMDSDSLDIDVADPRADIPWPRHGARLTVSLGYAHSGLVAMGSYVVDSVELSSPPRRWSIRGSAVDLRDSGLKTRRTRSWEGWPLGTVISEIASANGLQAKITPELAIIHIERVDQTNESDLALLTRLANQYGAIATVKGGFLLFARRGSGQTVSGQAMPPVAVDGLALTDWRVSLSDQRLYTAVEARFYDRDSAQEVWTRAGKGDGNAVFRLRRTYPDRASAQSAAEAKLGALARGRTLLSATLPGRTDVVAETPVDLSGYGDGVDGRWIVTSAIHRLSGSGYALQIECEREP